MCLLLGHIPMFVDNMYVMKSVSDVHNITRAQYEIKNNYHLHLCSDNSIEVNNRTTKDSTIETISRHVMTYKNNVGNGMSSIPYVPFINTFCLFYSVFLIR